MEQAWTQEPKQCPPQKSVQNILSKDKPLLFTLKTESGTELTGLQDSQSKHQGKPFQMDKSPVSWCHRALQPTKAPHNLPSWGDSLFWLQQGTVCHDLNAPENMLVTLGNCQSIPVSLLCNLLVLQMKLPSHQPINLEQLLTQDGLMQKPNEYLHCVLHNINMLIIISNV